MIPTPKTNEEWASLISQTKSSLPPTIQTTGYPPPPPSSIPATIDHTLLSLSATESQIDMLCAEAHENGFAAVCVRLKHVARAVESLGPASAVRVACVVGFHEGTYSSAEKAAEATEAVRLGATELDMVINYPLLLDGRFTDVYRDIVAVRNAAADNKPVLLKVILETSQLSSDRIVAGCVLSGLAGADFVKTSTGFNGPGASVENVALMRAAVDALSTHGIKLKVKASGGVRTAGDCVKMIRAGADRIGASAGMKIVSELAGGGSPPMEAPPPGAY